MDVYTVAFVMFCKFCNDMSSCCTFSQAQTPVTYTMRPPTHFYMCTFANCLHGLFAQYVGWEGVRKEGRDVILSHGCLSTDTTVDDG